MKANDSKMNKHWRTFWDNIFHCTVAHRGCDIFISCDVHLTIALANSEL